MPTMHNYLNLLYVNLGFIAQIVVMMYFRSAAEIRDNWPQYRCNPTFWIFSENISDDFTYCVQNTQMNMMGYLLQPLNSMIGTLTNISGEFGDSLNSVRTVFSSIRNFLSEIIENVFGVFLNLIVEFQKMIISIKDMVGKMIGIVVTIMYVLDGSIKTMNSAWSGPPGQLVKSIGSCFHPKTRLTLADGTSCFMEDAPLGGLLPDGAKIFAVLKIANLNQDSMYKLVTNKGQTIYVTGKHFLFDSEYTKKWIQVKDYKHAELLPDFVPEYFSCLITTSRHICIDDLFFWDWEDDELTNVDEE